MAFKENNIGKTRSKQSLLKSTKQKAKIKAYWLQNMFEMTSEIFMQSFLSFQKMLKQTFNKKNINQHAMPRHPLHPYPHPTVPIRGYLYPSPSIIWAQMLFIGL